MINMFYSEEYRNQTIAEAIQSTPPPYKSVKARIVPDPEGDPCLYLVLFLENFAAHSTAQQTSIGEWAGVVITKIRDKGIPCYLMRIKDIE